MAVDYYDLLETIRYKDLKRVVFGKKKLVKSNDIGYTAIATLVKCFVGFYNDKKPSDYFDYHDIKQYDEIEIELDDIFISEFYDIYCRRFPRYVRVNKINQKAIDEIKELVNRTLDYMSDKNIVFYDTDVFIVGSDVYTISISVEGPSPRKLAENTSSSVYYYDEDFHIDNWYIYNPRLDGEWSCNVDETIDKINEEKLNKEKQMKILRPTIDVDAALKSYESEIEKFEFDDLFDQALLLDERLTRQKAFRLVENIRNRMDISFKDAFYLYLDDLELGNKHGINDVVFDGVLYSSKMDIYRDYFPDHTEDEIQSSIGYKMRQLNMTWEDALRATIKNPPEKRSREIIYKGRKYKSTKALLKILFPKKRYESIHSSIQQLAQKENISFEEAIERYKEKGKPANIKKEVEYNGVKYPSLRSACKALGLPPEKVSHLAKDKFKGIHSKAIEFLMKEQSK